MEKTYTVSIGTKIFYSIAAAAMVGFSIFLYTIRGSSPPPIALVIPPLIISGAVLIVIGLIRRKVIIDDQRIIYFSLFNRKELELTAIKGCRVGQRAIWIEGLSSTNPDITIRNFADLDHSDALSKWCADNFKDLDAIDLAHEREKTLEDSGLGLTEADRKESIKKAKEIAIAYDVLGPVLAFAAIFTDNKAIIILMLAYPLAGICMMALSKGLVKFVSDSKQSVKGALMIGMAIPSFLLLVKSIGEYNLYQYDHLWFPAMTIFGVIFFLLYAIGLNRSLALIKTQAVIMVIVALVYGFGSALEINFIFDHSKPESYTAKVLARRIARGKSTSYYVTLSPWGPREIVTETEVPRHLYSNLDIGDKVELTLKAGMLNIPWFTVAESPTIISPFKP